MLFSKGFKLRSLTIDCTRYPTRVFWRYSDIAIWFGHHNVSIAALRIMNGWLPMKMTPFSNFVKHCPTFTTLVCDDYIQAIQAGWFMRSGNTAATLQGLSLEEYTTQVAQRLDRSLCFPLTLTTLRCPVQALAVGGADLQVKVCYMSGLLLQNITQLLPRHSPCMLSSHRSCSSWIGRS